jgi:putative ABC transport system ATP-binding protein
MNRSAIELQNIEFSWPGKPRLLSIAEFYVAAGERLFLRGPSGSGKSTLLGILGGVLAPQRGIVRLLGQDLTALSASERDVFRGEHIGFIFQMFNLIPYLTVRENVLLPLRFSSARARRLTTGSSAVADPAAEAVRLLNTLGLSGDDLIDRPVTQLSIGQQQRVAAARALLGRPEIIVADEPTSSLDHDARENFLQLLMQECRTQNSTLIFVSHDTSLSTLFDRTVSLDELNATKAQAA